MKAVTSWKYFPTTADWWHSCITGTRSDAQPQGGYVNLDSDASQDAKAYKETLYTSVNVIGQVQERFSVGQEGLYGSKETKDGSDGDVFRLQLGMVYSVF